MLDVTPFQERPPPIAMPGPDASAQEVIAFLQHQLRGALWLLEQRNETEAQIVGRVEKQYAAGEQRLRQQVNSMRKNFEIVTEKIRLNAARYQLLREYQVQIWKLGIAAEGEMLDKLLDAKLEQRSVA